jgi:serine/threonine protein kinase
VGNATALAALQKNRYTVSITAAGEYSMSAQLIGKRYQLDARLGEGGMGTVFRGVDTQTHETIAIKHLKPELLATDPQMLAGFAREAEALRQLNHPHIVKALATLEDSGQYYIILEYVSGGSLADVLRSQQTLPVSRVLDIALDLSDALIRAHRLNIIHRDLKPANVLIADDGTPRLTDFGIAFMRGKERVTETQSIVGTLDYLSPEAFQASEVDARSDLWAFGVLLFELLCGQRPFDRPTMSQTMMAILTEAPADLEALCPDCPVALVDLIYRMLEKDKQQRIPSARAVGAELENIQQGRSTASARQIKTDDTPTPTPTPTANHNLPAQATPFVGREHEIAEVIHLLDKSRLITLLAPGGMGKTRLALEIANTFVGAWHANPSTDSPLHVWRGAGGEMSGVYFVALAPLASADFIVSTIAEAVGFQFYQGGEPKQQLLDYFREKSMLLVMDNFEHLLEGAGIVADILAYTPQVKIIAASRECLNLSGEVLFALSGMDFPQWETPADALNYAAVKLFMQSALRVRPDFELTGGGLTYLARICRLVAGMPLGIVLAAAWLEMLTLAEIADEISKSIDFLETEMRDIPERQRSIRAVFDYSWNLMSEDERAVFMKLAVFPCGFTREAAQVVAGASLKTLMSLVNKSLIRRDASSGRYEVHELLRQYGEGKLIEKAVDRDTAHDAHSAYFAKFLGQRRQWLRDYRQKTAASEIQAKLDNIRFAWRTMIQKQKEDEIAQCVLSLFFALSEWSNSFQEAVNLFEMAFQSIASTSSQLRWLKGYLLSAESCFVFLMGNHVQAHQQIHAAEALLAKCDNLEYLTIFNLALAWMSSRRSDAVQLRQAANHLLPTYAKGTGLFCLMYASLLEGDIQQAHQHLLEGIKFSEEQGDALTVA